mmetsp:Transcript_13657/g.36748  ORF Transcript_13657/g.36748 Transcript_13657/m.36748 type:complete len:178 (-) Transcript_13657:219-752(-)
MATVGLGSVECHKDAEFFSDVHTFLHNIMGEIHALHGSLAANEDEQLHALNQLQKDFDQELSDNREQLNLFHHDFEELVHSRVGSVMDTLETSEKRQKLEEKERQLALDTLQKDVHELRRNLRDVAEPWRRLKRNSREAIKRNEELAEQARQAATRHSILLMGKQSPKSLRDQTAMF